MPVPKRHSAPRSAVAPPVALAAAAGRGALAWLLYRALLAGAAWAGQSVLAPGAWIEADLAVYRALNGVELGPITAVELALLNDPGPVYLVMITLMLGYCAWRRRTLLPAAALATALALALGQQATGAMHRAGTRERPFVLVTEALTPIAHCGAPVLLTLRNTAGPTAACDGSPAEVAGLDWRAIWLQFPTFPSGHMRETAALCVLLAAFWRRAWPYALGFSLVMALSRVHLGAHYPTDMLAGALAGATSGAITLLGLDAVARLAKLLYHVPSVGSAWDWAAHTNVPGRPDLDPPMARVIRSVAYVAGAMGALYVLGFTLVSGEAGQLYDVLQGADDSAFGLFTRRFDPAIGQLVYVLLGPLGISYAVMAVAALVTPTLTAGGERRRAIVFAALSLVVSLALTLALLYVGSRWFNRPQPFTQAADAPIPPEWRSVWLAHTSFPNGHVLLLAALGALVLPANRVAAVLGQLIALAGAVAAVYSGSAWLSDALASCALGTMAAAIGRYLVRQVVPDPR